MELDELWARVEAWLAVHAPRTFVTLNPPAADGAVADLADRLGTLPDVLVVSLRRHNGADNSQSAGFSFPGNFYLLGTAEIAESRAIGVEMMRRDSSVRGRYWHEAWIPFAANFSGSHLVYDAGGEQPYGRVFYHLIGDGPFGGRWDSLQNLFKDTLDALTQKPKSLVRRLPANYPRLASWATSRATVEAGHLVWVEDADADSH